MKHEHFSDLGMFWVVEAKRFWHVKLKLNSCNGQISFNDGWKNFVTDNKLKLGDVCVFQLVEAPRLFF
jgi:hypothetical protein